MLAKEYIKLLNEIINRNPDAANYEVILRADSEGCNYEKAEVDPEECFYEDGGELTYGDADFVREDKNAICLN